MRPNSVWKNHNQWSCLNHLPSTSYPAGLEECWYSNCPSERPEESKRPADPNLKAIVIEMPAVKVSTGVCEWEGCSKPARDNSKYCSRNCSNKNARHRHKLRKQIRKTA